MREEIIRWVWVDKLLEVGGAVTIVV